MENKANLEDELRPGYDASVIKNGVRGKYLAQYRSGTNAEASLLKIINAPLAPQERSERDALLVVQAERELTVDELKTLSDLIDTVEMANAERWQTIAVLARLRGLSLVEIARDLEIPFA